MGWRDILIYTGDRDSMEDSAATAKNFEPYMNEPTIYGIYDGHGGAQW